MKKTENISRRQFIGIAATLGTGLILPAQTLATSAQIHKTILKTGEQLPVIGMGTSRTFDAIGDAELLLRLEEVLQTFFDMSGKTSTKIWKRRGTNN